jgi:hypothetical protein
MVHSSSGNEIPYTVAVGGGQTGGQELGEHPQQRVCVMLLEIFPEAKEGLS